MFARRCKRLAANSARQAAAKVSRRGAGLRTGGDRGASCRVCANPPRAVAFAAGGVASRKAFCSAGAAQLEATVRVRTTTGGATLIAETAGRLAATVGAVLPGVTNFAVLTIGIAAALRRRSAFAHSAAVASYRHRLKAVGAWPGATGRGSPAAGAACGESARPGTAGLRSPRCRSADSRVATRSTNGSRGAAPVTTVVDGLEQGVLGRAPELAEKDEPSRPRPGARKGAFAGRHELRGQGLRETARRNRQVAEEWAETRRSWPQRFRPGSRSVTK